MDHLDRPPYKTNENEGFNPYLDTVINLWNELLCKHPNLFADGWREGLDWQPSSFSRMEIPTDWNKLQRRYSFAIPNDQAIEKLASLGPLIEMGAGTGYWGWLLRKKGVDIVLYDLYPPRGKRINRWHGQTGVWTKVQRGGPDVVTKHPGRTLFLCWPPADHHATDSPEHMMASDALSSYVGDTLAYVGRCAFGNTGDRAFHFTLDREWDLTDVVEIPSWAEWDAVPTVHKIPKGLTWTEVKSHCFKENRDKLYVFKRRQLIRR